MTQAVEGFCSLALWGQSSQIESENCLLFSVKQFYLLLLDPEARDAHQSANTDERLQLTAQISFRKFRYKSRDLACRHWHFASQVTNPVMVALTKAELPVRLVEQALAKPDSPFEGIKKGGSGPDNLP